MAAESAAAAAPAGQASPAPHPPAQQPISEDSDHIVAVQALARGSLERRRASLRRVRARLSAVRAWQRSGADLRQWVVRPRLVIDLLQRDHFLTSSVANLMLYTSFLICFLLTVVLAQRDNIYYEMERGLLQRFEEMVAISHR